MNNCFLINAQHKFDPTRTIGLRDRFSKQMKKSCRALAADLSIEIKNSSLFVYSDLETYGVLESVKRLFSQVKNYITYYFYGHETIPTLWGDRYITEAYQKGVFRARQELRNAGYKVPSIESTGGILTSLNETRHITQLGLVRNQTLLDLQNLSNVLETTVTKIINQGLISKESADVVASKVVKVITGVGEVELPKELGKFVAIEYRAATLARTNVVRTHHLAMVKEFEKWEITDVFLMAEFVTAGDDKVCPVCAELQGVHRLEDTIDMIPVHPNCRCVILPIKL